SWAAPSSVSTAPAAARAPAWRYPAAVIRPITTTAPMRVARGSGSGAVHSAVSSPARKAAASPATTTRARSSPWILIPVPSRPPCAGAPVLEARVPGARAAGRENGSPPPCPGRSVGPIATPPRSPAQPARPDATYAEPRLAACYDTFDGLRDDLDHYQQIIAELDARSVIDVGCGTGSLATRLAADGLAVTGVDPARASLDIARAKPHGDAVRWLHGTAADLPALDADAAVMTGNVAQVFLTDQAWAETLRALRAALRRGGALVFETRRPQRRAWEEWQAATEETVHHVPGVGRVVARPVSFEVALPLVTFSDEFTFEDGTTLTSTSTLRWRDEAELRDSLTAAGLAVEEIRDAPDRPGREFVVIARAV